MADGVRARCGLLALVLSALLGWSPHAAAQHSDLPASVIAPSRENVAIRNQLTLARKLEHQALQGFMARPADNSIPIDAGALQAARNAYVLIRAARHGMGWQKEAKKSSDPVLDLVFKRVDDAWNLSRMPVDHSYDPRTIPAMTDAIRLLDQALTMMP